MNELFRKFSNLLNFFKEGRMPELNGTPAENIGENSKKERGDDIVFDFSELEQQMQREKEALARQQDYIDLLDPKKLPSEHKRNVPYPQSKDATEGLLTMEGQVEPKKATEKEAQDSEYTLQLAAKDRGAKALRARELEKEKVLAMDAQQVEDYLKQSEGRVGEWRRGLDRQIRESGSPQEKHDIVAQALIALQGQDRVAEVMYHKYLKEFDVENPEALGKVGLNVHGKVLDDYARAMIVDAYARQHGDSRTDMGKVEEAAQTISQLIQKYPSLLDRVIDFELATKEGESTEKRQEAALAFLQALPGRHQEELASLGIDLKTPYASGAAIAKKDFPMPSEER